MEITIQKVSPLGRRIKFDIPSADLNTKIDEQMRSLAKSTFVPGFRKGRVPKAVLQRKYGAALRTDAMASLVSERIFPVLNEKEIAPVTPPFITDFSSDGRECFLYFEVSPEIIETELLGQKTVRPKVRITPEVIDDEIDTLKAYYKKWKIVERPAERGDRILARVTLSELISDKSIPMDDSGDQLVPIHLTGKHTLDEVVEACIGQSVGNLVTVKSATPHLFRTDEQEQLNPDLPKQTFVFEITVSRIEKPLEDQYQDELYDSFKIKSVHDEDFREKVCFKLNKRTLERVYDSLLGQIRVLLMHINNFEPSEYMVIHAMVKALQAYHNDGDHIENMFRDENQTDLMEDLRQRTAANVKWGFIEQNLMGRISPEQHDQFEIASYSNVWAMPRKDDEEEFSAAGESMVVGWDSSARSLVNHVLSKSECQEIEMSLAEFNQWTRDYHPLGHEHHHHEHHHHEHHHHEHHESEHSEIGEHENTENTSVDGSSVELAGNLVPAEAQIRSAIYSQLGITVEKVSG